MPCGLNRSEGHTTDCEGRSKTSTFARSCSATLSFPGSIDRRRTVDPQKLACPLSGVNLPRSRNLLLGIRQHLLPLGQPSHGARNREQHGKHLRSESHGLVHDPGVEVDIGIQLALDEVIVFQRDALQLEGDIELRVAPSNLEYLVCSPFDDLARGS